MKLAVFRAAVAVAIGGAAYAQTPPDGAPREIGVIYYAEGSGFKALTKEAAAQSGRYTYSAKVKGAHAAVRLAAGEPQTFRVCGVDPPEPNDQRRSSVFRIWITARPQSG